MKAADGSRRASFENGERRTLAFCCGGGNGGRNGVGIGGVVGMQVVCREPTRTQNIDERHARPILRQRHEQFVALVSSSVTIVQSNSAHLRLKQRVIYNVIERQCAW